MQEMSLKAMVMALETSHFEMSLSNDLAAKNMECMEVTLDTSHFEMSPLNDVVHINMSDMEATLDTHVPLLEIAVKRCYIHGHTSSVIDSRHAPLPSTTLRTQTCQTWKSHLTHPASTDRD